MNRRKMTGSESVKNRAKRVKAMLAVSSVLFLGLTSVMVIECNLRGIHGVISGICLGGVFINALSWFSWGIGSRWLPAVYQIYRILVMLVGFTGAVIHWHVAASVFQPFTMLVAFGLSLWACRSAKTDEPRGGLPSRQPPDDRCGHPSAEPVAEANWVPSGSRRQMLKRTSITVAGLAAIGSAPVVVNALDREKSLQLKALHNLLKMGHCAPTVAQTLFNTAYVDFDPVIRLAGAMAGGIGNLGAECGGLSSAALFLGARFGISQRHETLPELFSRGRLLIDRFQKTNGSLLCRKILGDGNMLGCIRAIRTSPDIAYSISGTACPNSPPLTDFKKAAVLNSALAEFETQGFHCCHYVFGLLQNDVEIYPLVEKATSGFIGGMFLSGLTCSALAAGVMAIGLKWAEIEDSYISVLRMMKIMAANDARAMDNDVNRFNRSINTSNRLVKWFEQKYGTTTCNSLIRTDFSNEAGVNRFFSKRQITNCRKICEAVAQQTHLLIDGDK